MDFNMAAIGNFSSIHGKPLRLSSTHHTPYNCTVAAYFISLSHLPIKIFSALNIIQMAVGGEAQLIFYYSE